MLSPTSSLRTRDPDNFHTFVSSSRITRLLQRAPATTQLLIPYVLLILPQAVLNGNPKVSFILATLGLALLGTGAIELAARPISFADNLARSRSMLAGQSRALLIVALTGCAVGQASSLANAALGGGTIVSQVGIVRVTSNLVPLLSLLSSWSYSGPALLAVAYLANQCSRRLVIVCFGVMVAMECCRTFFTLITASLIGLVVYLFVLLLFAGIAKAKYCLAAVVIVLLIWPAVFSLRNSLRTDAGVRASASVDAYDRLRYDLQVTAASDLPVGIDLGQPDIGGIARYGLIPRALDSDRPELSTGKRINSYLGGSDKSAFNFLPVATLYILEGPVTVIFFYSGVALALFMLTRSGSLISPLRLVGFGAISSGILGWFGSFPDSAIGAVQACVAAVPLLVLVRFGGIFLRRKNPGRSSVIPSSSAAGAATKEKRR